MTSRHKGKIRRFLEFDVCCEAWSSKTTDSEFCFKVWQGLGLVATVLVVIVGWMTFG